MQNDIKNVLSLIFSFDRCESLFYLNIYNIGLPIINFN